MTNVFIVSEQQQRHKTTSHSFGGMIIGGQVLDFFKNDGRAYIIAEIGGNFSKFDEAKRMIDLAKRAGVDSVKIQTFKAENLASKKAIFDMENTGVVSQFDLFKKFEVDENLHFQIADYVSSLEMDFFSTPSHPEDVVLLDRIGVPAYKVGSDDANNLPFLSFLAKRGKPIILSTGMCDLDEVKESVECIFSFGNRQVSLLHAITAYPTHPEDVNLGSMISLKNEFPELAVGYSDHTIGPNACIFARAMGAAIIEKHFTFDKNADGPDHRLSADFPEMKLIVDTIREFEVMRGSGKKVPAKGESITRINNRKSVVANRDIKKGMKISLDMLNIKRPGTGIAPKYLETLIGKTTNEDISADDPISWSQLE